MANCLSNWINSLNWSFSGCLGNVCSRWKLRSVERRVECCLWCVSLDTSFVFSRSGSLATPSILAHSSILANTSILAHPQYSCKSQYCEAPVFLGTVHPNKDSSQFLLSNDLVYKKCVCVCVNGTLCQTQRILQLYLHSSAFKWPFREKYMCLTSLWDELDFEESNDKRSSF